MSDDFLAVLHKTLRFIDYKLAAQDVELSKRPLLAAIIFVEDFILDIRGATKENYSKQAWFFELEGDIRNWYRDRYGKRALQRDEDVRAGVVLVMRAPYKLIVPVVRTWPHGDGTAWFQFPVKVMPGEDPLAWVQDPPNWEQMPFPERAQAIKDAATVTKLVRSIHADLIFVDPSPEAFQSLTATIEGDLAKVAEGILSGKPGGVSTAMWELHLAAEKALKAFLAQQSKPFDRTHNLKALYREAVAVGLPALPGRIVGALPHHTDSIRHRYGQMTPPTIGVAYKRYRLILFVVSHCTRYLKRSMVGRNVALRLRPLDRRRRPE